MKRKVLGLDINDEYVAASVIELRGQDKVVTAFGFERFMFRDDLAEILPRLLAQVHWKDGACTCGISLSGVSIRNLVIPFTENRKIAQVLPLELEDQLLKPVGDQVIEYSVCGIEEEQSHLLVAALEKKRLEQDLDLLGGTGLDPETITLRTIVLAEELQRYGKGDGSFLFLEAELYTANLAIVMGGKVVFLRRLIYPDRVFTARPFSLDEEGPRIDNLEDARECVVTLCDDIKRSVGLFELESGMEPGLENIFVSGSMSHIPEFLEMVVEEFDTNVEVADLRQFTSVAVAADTGDEWIPTFLNHSLALALQGVRKKTTFNFRKDEFALQRSYLASKTNMAVAAAVVVLGLAGIFAYLGFDYQALNSRYKELGQRMEGIFKETFPEATRIVDPLVQMKTNLRNVQAPSIATPIFSGDKRTLNILADISGRVPVSVKIHVSRLVVDKDSVVIKGTTDTFNNVNLIQGVLLKSPSYQDVNIVSAVAEKNSGLIRFELKLQTAGAS